MSAAFQSWPGQGLPVALPKYFPTTLQGNHSSAISPPSCLVINCSKQMNTWDLDDLVIQVNDLGIQVNKSEMSETFSFIPTSG